MSSERSLAPAAMRALRLGLADVALATWALSAAASQDFDRLDRGPKVGEPIPHPLTALDQHGTKQSFLSIKGKAGLILLFSRSMDWCPYCQAEAIAWNERLGEATKLGYNVALVTYDSVAELARFSKRREIAYPILSDGKSEIIRAFDILNEEHEPGSRAHGIPYPIIFVVDSRGVVRLRFSEEHYRDRPKIDRVLETIRKQTW